MFNSCRIMFLLASLFTSFFCEVDSLNFKNELGSNAGSLAEDTLSYLGRSADSVCLPK